MLTKRHKLQLRRVKARTRETMEPTGAMEAETARAFIPSAMGRSSLVVALPVALL